MASSKSGSRAASKSGGASGAKTASKSSGGAGGVGGSRGGGQARGTSDVSYNLISVAYHALQGAETYGIYANDAEQDGNRELADFFRRIQEEGLKRAEEAKALLKRHL